MCAIVGSSSIETLKELVALNSYRGSHSHSLSMFNKTTGILSILVQKLGAVNLDTVIIPANNYCIVHVQAPTTEARTIDSVHPAIITDRYKSWPQKALWHNGIIKAEKVQEKASEYDTSWDTMQILKGLQRGYETLNELDGTFSCLYYDQSVLSLNLFRNEISPMFIDDKLNISSTKFTNSVETQPNTVLKMDFNKNNLVSIHEFETVENPYFFGE